MTNPEPGTPSRRKILRRHFAEESILFASVVKWIALATAVGLIVGLSTTIFLKLLGAASSLTASSPFSFLFLPVALFLSAWLVKSIAPDAEGHGTEKVIEAIHKRSGKIQGRVVPVKLVATIITLAFGGSAGKEGPCAQIGAGLSSLFATLLRFDNHDRKKLVICGISAGFAAVFGTPIAGSIFGVEVLFIGGILYDVLLPSFIAGITAYQVSSALGITYFNAPITLVPEFSEAFLLKAALAGVFFGLCALFLVEVLKIGEWLSSKRKIWEPLKAFAGGVALVALALVVSPRYLGLGLDTIEGSLHGASTPWYAFMAKGVFTSITLSFGGSGGIVTPIFFIGATSGALFADLFHLSQATFAAIGLVAVLAGAANTPIAASIMSIELFGPAIAPYATVASVISFLMTGHRSVYPSQILSVRKSTSLQVELGKEIEEIETRYEIRKKGFARTVLMIVKKAEILVRRRLKSR